MFSSNFNDSFFKNFIHFFSVKFWGKNEIFTGKREFFEEFYSLNGRYTPENPSYNTQNLKTSLKQPIFDLKWLDFGVFRVNLAFVEA